MMRPTYTWFRGFRVPAARRRGGFTFIELVVAVGLSIILLRGMYTLFDSATKLERLSEQRMVSMLEISAIFDYIAGDIARSPTTSDYAVTAVIKDTEDGSDITITGTWPPSTSQPEHYGLNYLHDENAGKGTKSVKFTPTIVTETTYSVYMWWTDDPNRASNVPVDIVHKSGTATVSVNQRINGGQWNLLGTYTFETGTSGHVLVRTTGTDGYVIADAVKFEAVTGSGYYLDLGADRRSITFQVMRQDGVAGKYVYVRYYLSGSNLMRAVFTDKLRDPTDPEEIFTDLTDHGEDGSPIKVGRNVTEFQASYFNNMKTEIGADGAWDQTATLMGPNRTWAVQTEITIENPEADELRLRSQTFTPVFPIMY